MTDDPFTALEEAAKRKMAEKDAGDAIQAALVRLILGRDAKSPFFATLALRLKLKTDWDCPTAMTDGRSLGYNPGWIADLDLDQTIGLLAHEVLHCAGKHFARRGAREPSKWNVAIDLEINPMLREAGFTLPADGVFPGEGPHKDLPKGEAAERYYDLLPDPPSEEQDGEGEGPGQNPDPGGCGGVKDAGDKAEQQQAAAEMEVAVAQAAEAAKQRGALPGGLNRLVQEIVNPKVDWRDTLREYVSSCARNDYSWSPPNRRYVHLGLYLPSLRSEELGDVVLAVDTSGSIGQKELNRFAAEAQGLLESYDCALDIVYHDSKVQKVDHWESTDGDLRLEPVGGGGTDHCCIFDHIRQSGAEPTVLVCLTDMYSRFPDEAPPYPVIWARIGGGGRAPKWGRLVEVE